MEHRWGRRRRVILPVRLGESGQTTTMGWLTDISLSGGYVKTLPGPALLAQVSVEVGEPDDGGSWLRPLQLRGRVVRRGPTGIGIEWEEFASETLARIVRIATPAREPGFAASPDEAPDQGFQTGATYVASDSQQSFIAS
jgi:hypothetical protein